jgi:glutaredoxin
MRSPSVVLYSRPGCHLCEDALEVVRRVRERRRFELQELNIEDDERLHRAYLERIPVICIDGREAFELFVDEAAFESALGAADPAQGPR